MARLKSNSVLITSYLSFVAWLIPSAFSLMIPILLMRDAGVESYGIYALLVGVAGFFTIADLSMDAFLIPRIVEKTNRNEVIRQSRKFFNLSAFLVFIVAVLCFYLFKKNNILNLNSITYLQILLIALFAASQLLVTSSYIEASGFERLNFYSARTLYINLANILAIFIMYKFGLLSIEALLFSKVITNYLISIRLVSVESLEPKKVYLKYFFDEEALRFIKIALFGKFISVTTFNIDKIIIASYLTVWEVGIVSYPMQLGLAMLMGASKLCLPLLPISACDAPSAGATNLDRTVKSFVDILVLDIGIIVVLASLWIPNLVTHIYHTNFYDLNISVQFAAILVGFWLISFSGITSNILPGWKKMGVNIFSATVRGVIVILIMLLSIQSMGIFAVGFALIFAGIWELSFLIWFTWRYEMEMSRRRIFKCLGFMIIAMGVLIPGKYLLLKDDVIYTSVISLVLLLALGYSSFKMFLTKH